MSLWSTTLPLHFWYWGSSSEFLKWHRSINDAKWKFPPLFLASSITSFSSAAMPGFSTIFHVLSPLLPLHLAFLLLEAQEWICEQDCNDSETSSRFQWYNLGDVCVLSSLGLVLSSTVHLAILFLHPRSSIFNIFLQQYVQWCKCCSGNVDVR